MSTNNVRPGEGQEEDLAESPLSKEAHAQVHLPRVAIKFCTQCKWMLRAAYVSVEFFPSSNTLPADLRP